MPSGEFLNQATHTSPQSSDIEHYPRSMVFVVTAWSEEDGHLNVRISRNSGEGFHRETVWASTPEEVADSIAAAIRELT